MRTHIMRRVGPPVASMLIAALLTGCGGSKDNAAEQTEAVKGTASEVSSDVAAALTTAEKEFIAKIAVISVAVDNSPAAAEAVLEKYGMTPEEYEAAVYRIAMNPALSDAFEKAKAK